MKVVALRGVCIGPEAHLAPGDEADVDKATAQFLTSINAVALVPERVPEPAPVNAEQPAADTTDPKPKAGKNGKKEI